MTQRRAQRSPEERWQAAVAKANELVKVSAPTPVVRNSQALIIGEPGDLLAPRRLTTTTSTVFALSERELTAVAAQQLLRTQERGIVSFLRWLPIGAMAGGAGGLIANSAAAAVSRVDRVTAVMLASEAALLVGGLVALPLARAQQRRAELRADRRAVQLPGMGGPLWAAVRVVRATNRAGDRMSEGGRLRRSLSSRASLDARVAQLDALVGYTL